MHCWNVTLHLKVLQYNGQLAGHVHMHTTDDGSYKAMICRCYVFELTHAFEYEAQKKGIAISKTLYIIL